MSQSFTPTRVDWLPNGMRVLTRELRHAPVASVMVWYGVGSRDERPGLTGLSHFLEHMMFKGTRRFPYGVLEEGVKRRGGMWNAFTSYDYTAYYEVLPARHLEYGLEVEADRMTNMTFDPDLTVRERGIIVSEREGRENSPHFWLFEAFMAAAYQRFPYGHQVLGHKEDIKATTAEALAAHYRQFYTPGNATLVVAGDVETERLLQLAHKHFGQIPQGSALPPVTEREPEQREERRVEVRRPGPHPHMVMGYKLPPADHPDQAALTLLSAVISGGPSFSMMGGGASMGRSSRFSRKLVDTGLATAASAHPWALQYGGLFLCNATPVPGVAPERLEAAICDELERLRQEIVPADELERARKQVRAQFVYGMESAINQAVMLGATALTQGVEHFDHALEQFAAVTAEDLLRVAQTYLAPQRRTVGWFQPQEEGAGTASPAAAPAPAAAEAAGAQGDAATPAYQQPGAQGSERPVAAGRQGKILDHEQIVRRELPGGAVLLVYPADTIPSVFVRVQLEAGGVCDTPGKEGMAQLTAQLLTRGTERHTAEALALKTDALGMSIRVDIGRETAVGSLKCLPEDLATGLDLLAEVLRQPTFPQDEMDRMRDRMLVAVREAENDTRSVASRRLSEALYPAGHPYRGSVNGTEESLRSLTREELQRFHSRHYGPRDAVISVVGNVEPAAVEAALLRAFDGWGGGEGRPAVPAAPAPAAARAHFTVPGKSQTDIALGWALVDRRHPDYLPLEFLATLFGGNGTSASSRLFRDVREKYGLSYYQFASFAGASGPGSWTAHIGVSPARLPLAIDVIQQELRRLAEEPIPPAELEALKAFLEDYPAVQHESPERLAARLGEVERFGLGLDYLERYPAEVAALTAGRLAETAARYLLPDRLALITAGPDQERAT